MKLKRSALLALAFTTLFACGQRNSTNKDLFGEWVLVGEVEGAENPPPPQIVLQKIDADPYFVTVIGIDSEGPVGLGRSDNRKITDELDGEGVWICSGTHAMLFEKHHDFIEMQLLRLNPDGSLGPVLANYRRHE